MLEMFKVHRVEETFEENFISPRITARRRGMAKNSTRVAKIKANNVEESIEDHVFFKS